MAILAMAAICADTALADLSDRYPYLPYAEELREDNFGYIYTLKDNREMGRINSVNGNFYYSNVTS